MKCEYCGGDVNIEQSFCSNCGKPNKYYEAHRRDMASYEKRFERTENAVVGKVNRTSRKAVSIVLISVLSALILGEVAILANLDDINYTLEKRRNDNNSKEIAAMLGNYEESEDYADFAEYYTKYGLTCHKEEVNEYNAVASVISEYRSLRNICSSIAAGETAYNEPYDLAGRINNYLSYAYDGKRSAIERSDDIRYSGKHLDTINKVIEEMHAYLCVYLGLDSEVVNTFPEMKDSDRFNIINDKLEEVMADEEQ